MLHSERLRVPFWWWLAALALTLALALAVFAYVDWRLALAVTASLLAGLTALLVGYGNTRVAVTDGALTAGRARIERHWIGRVEALDARASEELLGPRADHRAFLLTRPYIPTVVRIDVADPADPHPYWVVSSRNAEQLARAVRTMKED